MLQPARGRQGQLSCPHALRASSPPTMPAGLLLRCQLRYRAHSPKCLQLVSNVASFPTLMTPGPALLPAEDDKGQGKGRTSLPCPCQYRVDKWHSYLSQITLSGQTPLQQGASLLYCPDEAHSPACCSWGGTTSSHIKYD